MYTRCIFCHSDLGRNDSVEQFTVGQRLAFDEGRGRLWLVCTRCERWNLSPLEERWEAIEQCERLFRSTRLRVSTENIGLARLKDGTDLVRIGRPLRPEFASWRYGDQFGRRRRRRIARGGLGIGLVGALTLGISATGLTVTGMAYTLFSIARVSLLGNPQQVVATLTLPGGAPVKIRRKHLAGLRLTAGQTAGDWSLRP